MAITRLNPYLNFNGTAEKAIALYEKALGARTEGLMRFGDMAGTDAPADAKNRVMHALLHIGGGVVMISDGPPNHPVPTTTNCHVALDFDDPTEMQRCFDALAVGGTVSMPLQDTFWGARFGMLTDAFAIAWMFNHDKKKD